MGRTPEFLEAPIGQDRDGKLTAEEDLKQRLASLAAESKNGVQGYDRYAIEYAPQYRAIFRRLAAGDLPAVEHCSSGKDRTGVFAAILLTALGVPRKVVIQDYLLTGKYMLAADNIERTAADLRRILGLSQPLDASAVQALMTTKRERMEATLDSITRTYGSFGNYLRDCLQISDSELAMLRQRLLQP
jgi:protein-tyrosine phosphatase